MKNKLFAVGLVLALSIVGVAWARQPAIDTANRTEVRSSRAQTAATVIAIRPRMPWAANPRLLLGLWLLTMTGTAVVRGARRRRGYTA